MLLSVLTTPLENKSLSSVSNPEINNQFLDWRGISFASSALMYSSTVIGTQKIKWFVSVYGEYTKKNGKCNSSYFELKT